MNERLSLLPLPTPAQLAYSSGTASPRFSSIASSTSSNADSQSSYTSAASSNGPKTPPLNSLPVSAYSSSNASVSSTPQAPPPLAQPTVAPFGQYQAMNQPPPDMYYQQPHMPAAQAPPAQPVASSALAQYNPHQQPSLMQQSHGQYGNPTTYGQYTYANGLTSPPTGAPAVSNPMVPTTHVLPLPGVATQQSMQNNFSGFDTSGQIAPPGMKPRVTATLWEDEGSLCFQVEARGICVARREDNHMINGTKLLNVAGMTRGRRDGILKSEKLRHVVKIGPMHLKGVWIPFERALDFANKEKITELLFPLFVHNIAALLYHPSNQSRSNQVMAAAERRKQEQNQLRNGQPPASGLPSLQHHSGMALPGPQATLPSHTNMSTPTGRSSLDRSHTFPTPPTSASSVIGGSMSSSEPFQWPQQGVNGTHAATQMPLDAGMSNARSMPATPATTPPGPPLQAMQSYPSTSQAYDNTRSVYHQQSAAQQTSHQPPPQQHQQQHQQQQQQQHQHQHQQQQHQQQQQQQAHQTQAYAASAQTNSPQDRTLYSQNPATAVSGGYVKTEMQTLPSSRQSVAGPPGTESVEQKAANGLMHHHAGQGVEQVAHSVPVPEDETEHEQHDTEYTHDSSAYDNNRTQYNYAVHQATSLPNDGGHIATEMAVSANHHQASSGRSTPRSAAAPQAYYTQQGYNTPSRGSAAAAATQASSNLYNVVTNDRTTANAASTGDVYAPPADMNGGMQNGYAPPMMNGGSAGVKRGRDDDDDRSGMMDLKRRKTLMESSMPSAVYDTTMNRPTAPAIGARRHV